MRWTLCVLFLWHVPTPELHVGWGGAERQRNQAESHLQDTEKLRKGSAVHWG